LISFVGLVRPAKWALSAPSSQPHGFCQPRRAGGADRRRNCCGPDRAWLRRPRGLVAQGFRNDQL